MYAQDSFFDLTLWGRVGLLCISAVLFVVVAVIAQRLLRDRPVWLRIAGSLLLFWIFVWVSPQVYYMYYLTLFEGLPLQWVIWPPASPIEAAQLLVFQGPQNLSAHSQGLLGWSLLLIPFLRRSSRS